MGNTAGCATTHNVEKRSLHEEDNVSTPMALKPSKFQQAAQNNDPTSQTHNSTLSNEDSTIVNIPKGKSLRYVSLERTPKDTLESQHVLLKALAQNNMNDMIAFNTQQVLDREYLICVYPNLDKNILVYILTDGMDKLYYHIRDIESVIRDKNSLFSGEPSESVHFYVLYLNSVQHCIRTMDLFFEPQERDTILLSKRLLPDISSSHSQVTISIPLYPLYYNVDVNIRDVFMLITKHSKMMMKKQSSAKHVETKRQESLTLLHDFKKQTSTKSINDEKAHTVAIHSKDPTRLSLDLVNVMSAPGSLHSSPASTPRTGVSHHAQISELVNELRNHQNEEVRNLIARLESLLTESMNRPTTDSLAEVLVSKASVHSMNVRESVKDLIVSDDQETRKWLSDEVLKGTTLLEDSSDYSWKKKVKAFTKAIVFTNRLREMGSVATRKSNLSISLDLSSVTTQKEDLIELPFDILEYLKVHALSYYSFDVFKFEKIAKGEPLYYLCLYLFQTYDLANNLNIPVKTIKAFLKDVESQYRNNPYHNNCHATDVVQSAFSLYHSLFAEKSVEVGQSQQQVPPTPSSNTSQNILQSIQSTTNTTSQLYFHLNPLDILALLVACLAHDVCHPGVTNLFEKKTRSERAIMFNDRSILENFHCYSLFKILSKEETNLFVNMNNHQFEYLRELIVEMILATDISQHFLIVGQMKSNDIFNHEKFTIERKECLLALLKVLIKCADVSNPTKRFPVYGQWLDRIMNEFYNQGDRERELNIDISPFMDRNNQNVPKCQTGFMEFIVMPLFSLLFDFKPEDSKYIREQTEFNYKSMQEMCKNGQMLRLDEILEVMKQTTLDGTLSQHIHPVVVVKTSPRPSSQPSSSRRKELSEACQVTSSHSPNVASNDGTMPTTTSHNSQVTTINDANLHEHNGQLQLPLSESGTSKSISSGSGSSGIITPSSTSGGAAALTLSSTTPTTSAAALSSSTGTSTRSMDLGTKNDQNYEDEAPLVAQSIQEDGTIPLLIQDVSRRIHRENLIDDDEMVETDEVLNQVSSIQLKSITTLPNEDEYPCHESFDDQT
ncbi:hypothetical protein C9374_004928 [Naegleria lovaniensis]|uniref:Phosphodiesterase n=1 Tax=Naegleria lovaniensis TaxID=51637 RepID=A0AA88GPL7_NAELO|nr:uncharacterized protein C9374_004928 [Naegleria lovaniensis]KAG2382961.1 hypothetical protein C9374_004928 [Naegleria lovaniensis]